MKRSLLFIAAIFLFSSLWAQYEVRGGSGRPYSAHTNGLTEVYLLNGLEGSQIRFTSSQSGAHEWYRYKESINNAVPVPCTQSGNVSMITDIQEGCAYYVAAPLGTGYIWIVDYSRYVPRLSGLRAVEDEFRCEQLKLIADADVPPIYYYSSNGMRNTLQREFRLTYNSLSWEADEYLFLPKNETLTLRELFPEITVGNPPLANTNFTLTDVFAEHFGIAQAITSEEYRAVKVEAHIHTEKDSKFGEDESLSKGGESAPVSCTFTACANEPVAAYYIWKILKLDANGQSNTIVQWHTNILRYTFENSGKYEVQLEVNDAQSACVATESVSMTIDESFVKIPNAFSPGSSIGVNDELKIFFRSITSFQASVFNRWGNLLYQWTDPNKGWNGMVNGKFVPTGVYYVVVEYTDSEGKRCKDSRDVNVLRTKN